MGLGSDSSPVEVELHGVPTFLADSMQFSLEYVCRLSDAGAYYLMPSFRGEAPDTTHLCQFFHSEAEMPGGLDDVVGVVEQYLRHLAGHLLTHHERLIARMAGDLTHVENLLDRSSAFPRVTFDEVAALIGDPDSIHTDELGGWRSLTRSGERRLMERVGEFVWVTHWDHLSVPFYQAYDDNSRALNADLLFGPGEVVGAGERHATGEDVRKALAAHDVAVDGYEWYVTMKDLTPMRTSGFGLGVERFFMGLLRNDDIRDFQLLPRENGRNILP
jgi:aspartyl/asparaginyl-tRNA synthetase